MTPEPIPVPLRGQRDYILLADAYSQSLNIIAQKIPLESMNEISFAFRRRSGQLVFLDDSDHDFSAIASLSISTDWEVFDWYLKESSEPASQRIPYDEDAIYESCNLPEDGNQIELFTTAQYDYPIIFLIVALNKKLHLENHSGLNGHWSAVGVTATVPLHHIEPRSLKIEFCNRKSRRLTKSNIFVDGEYVGNLRFSWVSLEEK